MVEILNSAEIHLFPNPRTEIWLSKRLNKLIKNKDFCDCDEANWVDGFCWNCLKPSDPKEMEEDMRAERNQLNRKISTLKKASLKEA